MHSIVPRPPEQDDFFTPQVVAFAAAAMSILSALWSLWAIWLVYAGGCFRGECDSGDDGVGLGFLIWLGGQAALAAPTISLCVRVLAAGDAARGAVRLTLAGITFTIAIVAVTLLVVWTGS